MKTTSVYGIPYIEADDLVSSAPTQFRQTAEGVEKVLREIDARATPRRRIASDCNHAGDIGVTGRREWTIRRGHR